MIRCVVPAPAATTAARPPVITWARSIAKISAAPSLWPRAEGDGRTASPIA
ncbi:Uncharacterised protein [Mycobacteroides abscessus subsp. abscessus]|nr:Uncharacterised protein [Mycobacteroides abscessus subsp. abscessus]